MTGKERTGYNYFSFAKCATLLFQLSSKQRVFLKGYIFFNNHTLCFCSENTSWDIRPQRFWTEYNFIPCIKTSIVKQRMHFMYNTELCLHTISLDSSLLFLLSYITSKHILFIQHSKSCFLMQHSVYLLALHWQHGAF